MSACSYRKCRRKATEAWDVWSWFRPQREQTPRHYEVCQKHGAIFAGRFTDVESEKVARDYHEKVVVA